MGNKNFVIVTKQYFLFVCKLSSWSDALDSLNYIFVNVSIIEMRRYRLRIFFFKVFQLKSNHNTFKYRNVYSFREILATFRKISSCALLIVAGRRFKNKAEYTFKVEINGLDFHAKCIKS